MENIRGISEDDIAITRSLIGESIFSEDDVLEVAPLLAKVIANKSMGVVAFGTLDEFVSELKTYLEENGLTIPDSIDVYTQDFQEDVNKSLPDYLGRTILYMLNEEIFLQNGFDVNTELDYNYIVKQVQEKVTKSLPDFVKIHVGFELENMLRKIKGDL